MNVSQVQSLLSSLISIFRLSVASHKLSDHTNDKSLQRLAYLSVYVRILTPRYMCASLAA